MKKLVFAFLLLSAFLPNWCLAQRSCAFEDNGIRTAEEIEVARLASSAHKVTGNVRIIPVVVSVFYSTAGAASNISDAQVASGITILNEGFRAQYGGVDTEIEFCLSGIKRFLDPNSATAYIGGNELSLKTIAQEDPTRFYNVYIVEQIYTPAGDSAEGYTFTPKIMTLDDRYDVTLL